MNNKLLHLFVFLMISFSLSSYGMQLTEAILCSVDENIQQQQGQKELVLQNCIVGERCIIFETEDGTGSKKHFVFSLQDAMNVVNDKDHNKSLNDGAYLIQYQLTDNDKKIIQDAHTNETRGRGVIKQTFSDILQENMRCSLSYIQQKKIMQNKTEIIEDVTEIVKIKEQNLKNNLTQLISQVQLLDDIDTKEVYFTFQQEKDSLPKVMQAGIDSRIKEMFAVAAPDQNQNIKPKEELDEAIALAITNTHIKIQNLSDTYHDFEAAKKTNTVLAGSIEQCNRYVDKIENTKKEIKLLNEEIKKNESLIKEIEQKNNVSVLDEIDLFGTNLESNWTSLAHFINIKIHEADFKLDQYDEEQRQYKQAINRTMAEAEWRYKKEFQMDDTQAVDIAQKHQQATAFIEQYDDSEYNNDMKNLQFHIMSTIKALHPKLDFAQFKPQEDVIAQIKDSSPDIALFFKNMNIKVHPDRNEPGQSMIFKDTLNNIETDLKTAIPFYQNNKREVIASQQRRSAENWQFTASCGQLALMPTVIHEAGTLIASGLEYCFSNKQDQKDIDFLRQDTNSLKIGRNTIALSAYNKLHKRLQKKTTTQDLDRMSKILEDH